MELRHDVVPPASGPPSGPASGTASGNKARLIAITLDENSVGTANTNIEHEREVAIFDILDGNSFALDGRDDGPYKLHLAIVDDRLALQVGNETTDTLVTHLLSLTPLKRIMKDYFMVCDSYYEAIRVGAAVAHPGHRYGPPRAARRRQPHPVRTAGRQSHRRYRHRAPAVHAHLRPALEGLSRGR